MPTPGAGGVVLTTMAITRDGWGMDEGWMDEWMDEWVDGADFLGEHL